MCNCDHVILGLLGFCNMLSLDVDERVQDVVDRCCQSLQQYVSVVVMINVFNVDVCIGAVSS